MFSPSLSRSPLAKVLAAGVAMLFALGAALVSSVISAGPASAHAVLVKITPRADAQLTTAPKEVVLEFDEPVSTTFATVVVTTAAGVTVARGKPTVLGSKVTQALTLGLASGGYRVAFRVVSDDGHPISGKSTFTLRLTPATSPATSVGNPPASASASPSPATPSVRAVAGPSAKDPKPGQAGWLSRFLVPIVGAVGLLVIGAGVLLWDRQRP
jgi:methionine-rich copper-binding protein CopC